MEEYSSILLYILQVLATLFIFVIGSGVLVAIGMYELSRRREQGLDTSRWHAFEVVRSPSIGSIVILGLVLMVIYFAWLFAAQAIYVSYFGDKVPESVPAFVLQIFATSSGWALIFVVSGVGFFVALVVFGLSVVS